MGLEPEGLAPHQSLDPAVRMMDDALGRASVGADRMVWQAAWMQWMSVLATAEGRDVPVADINDACRDLVAEAARLADEAVAGGPPVPAALPLISALAAHRFDLISQRQAFGMPLCPELERLGGPVQTTPPLFPDLKARPTVVELRGTEFDAHETAAKYGPFPV